MASKGRDLYLISPPTPFTGVQRARDQALYSVVGAPFDSTSSYRVGQRFAPVEIRLASSQLESNGLYVEGDIDSVPIADEGDIAVVPGSQLLTLERIENVVAEIVGEGRVPVVIGGEHLVTLGVLRGFAKAGVRPCVAVLDAHLDLRGDYLGERYSHATVFRRAVEELSLKVFHLGVRAFDAEERSYADEVSLVEYITASRLEILGVDGAVVAFRRFASECKHIYLSVDMDVYDPAYAPGVSTPEPGGLTSKEGLALVSRLVDERFSGFDIVEVTPPYDPSGITSVLAAKTIQEIILASWASRSRGGRAR
ncbi:MAG: agmatinase [Aeropyrum sp.]|nr:agmatinase [Aeropyrum sp.]